MSDIVYRNVFKEIGKTDEEIAARLDDIVEQFFYGEDSFYHTAENDTGYFEDTGNHDARTEGMSYGMMMAVQLDKKDIFDRIWKWSKVNMFMTEGDNEGYFRWSCGTDGKSFADGPAPDGEEFYAMALFFASHRWGDGEGIFNYTHEAQEILRACLHKGENGRKGSPMWNRDNKLILFVPGINFSDASYHLPHFYELFAKWAYEEDREFFAQAAKASRDYIAVSCHPVTGMTPEYGEFDGSPLLRTYSWFEERHDWFFSDSYRTAANIGLDRAWGGRDDRLVDAVKRLQYTLGVTNREAPFMIYEV
ncbi:glycosyl hydrolase family 8, partial [uncultured Ruminococcus sp.]|uniref:glycosyl hydrolase family 8 n=1 Tax=uncultured Ruminococcus sp. TaxID=165186 RepID=UPI0025F939C6